MRFKATIRFLLLCALAASAYLLYATFGASGIAGCGPESGCDRVLQSRWSHWFGVPVSVFSVLVYAALLALTFRFRPKPDPAAERAAWRVIIPLVVLVIASVLWFAGLQIFVIKQMCKFCMTVHGAGLLASILLLRAAPIRQAPDKPWQAEKQVFVPPRKALSLGLVAFAAFAIFAAGQVLHKPKTFSTQSYSFQTSDGRFQFDLNDVPLIGSPKNTNIIVSVFDYTCHHCRIMHWHLMEAHQKLSNQLSIISLPNPLDGRCNASVRKTPPAHQQACDYAKLGLAVWRANHEAQHQFDNWIFTPEQPPDLTQAQVYAMGLVGSNQLAHALEDPWVEKTLQRGIAVYSTNYIHLHIGNMPQLIVGTNIVAGTFGDMAQMYRVLEQNLGVKVPSS